MAKNKFLKNLNVNQKLDSTYMFTKTKENKYIGNFEIEFAIENIAKQISKEIELYRKTKDKNEMNKLKNLLEDRDKIYNNNKEVIYKYINRKSEV